MAEIGKFVFTNEGRRMLIAQNGGIHFAVMGAILLTRGFKIDDDKEIKKVTWEDLKAGTYGTLGLKGIAYTSNGEGSEILTTDSNYTSALENILNRESTNSATYLFDTTYQPDMGVKDKGDNVYGLYSFGFDKTKFNCNGNPVFRSIVLIGKQYVTDGDAKYNVEEAQTPTVVGILSTGLTGSGIVEFDNGDEDRNKFTEFKFEWRITVTENPITEGGVELADSLSGINNGFRLINDGLKTDANVKLTIGDREIQEFNLNKEGNIATSKAVLIANMVDTDTLDEQLNQPGMLHLINKHNTSKTSNDPLDPNSYRPQQILSTIKYNTNFDNPVNAYHVKTTLTADSDDKVVVEGSSRDNIPDSPSTLGSFYSEATYDVNAIYDTTSHDNVAVNFFGLNNSAFDKSHAMFINSINNLDISNGEPECGSNLYLASNNNTYFWSDRDGIGPGYGKNVFINSYSNYSNSEHNTFINASDCITNITANASVLIGSEGLTCQRSTYNFDIASYSSIINDSWQTLLLRTDACNISDGNYSTMIACRKCDIKRDPYAEDTSDAANTYNKMMLNGYGLKGMNQYRQIIMGKYNASYYNYSHLGFKISNEKWELQTYAPNPVETTDVTNSTQQVSSIFVIGAGLNDTYRRNALEFSLMDPMTAWGSLDNNDGYLGKLTTDWIYAPYIENSYLETREIDCVKVNIEKQLTVGGVTARAADIKYQETENITAVNLTATNVKIGDAANVMIGNKTLKQYILDIINNS